MENAHEDYVFNIRLVQNIETFVSSPRFNLILNNFLSHHFRDGRYSSCSKLLKPFLHDMCPYHIFLEAVMFRRKITKVYHLIPTDDLHWFKAVQKLTYFNYLNTFADNQKSLNLNKGLTKLYLQRYLK